ncbi:unnamed protein product [Acanthoscelides obtectus]|uniref:UDP-N-acetylglucosamine diphosphorylase n=1 Tax=Acanthoscelides obtectus TaxID=200917 RepID=A0A9P0K474_ACAOB|nr:unnamed protein product [Acanthoscelides obtectus]CAK1664012.1 UDP-N-acetylhexosamine pyrophosphorylase [Acanthoscelides obtectus]
MCSLDEIKKVLSEAKQYHLLRFWKELTEEEKLNFIQNVSSIDFPYAVRAFDQAVSCLAENRTGLEAKMRPVPDKQFDSVTCVSDGVVREYRDKGLKAIAEGSVGVLLLAGGQGTRLGVTYPKGIFPLDLPSGKTLYQIQAERIRKVISLAEQKHSKRGKIFWYIMTSEATHNDTVDYFEKHEFFGLEEENVIFFKQGLLPCFDFDGNILLQEKDTVALAPDGNGGLYLALKKHKIIDDMKNRGVRYIHAYCVDNILVKVADPVFLGYCITKNADCGAKVIKKEIPSEPIGVVCEIEGTFQVIEYSEISQETANLRDNDGNLVYRSGNICNHFFTVDFLEKVSEIHESELPLHAAKKKIPYIDDNGAKTTPTIPNGIKIEKFIFDVFRFSDRFVTWEVHRHEEFSPLKNCESALKDCPSTVRRDLFDLHKNYVENAGGKVDGDIEISPLLSYEGEGLEDVVRGKVFKDRTVLFAECE